jgi:hypothetical protein
LSEQEFTMKWWPMPVLLLCAGSFAMPAHAQQPLDWVPRGVEEIGRTAAFHTDFTFDRSMLQFADGVMDGGGDPQEQRAAAKLNGISVHSYRFAAPGMYDPRALLRVHRQYAAAGWKHLVSTQRGGASGNGAGTDFWIDMQGTEVTGMTVLLTGERNLELIAISCELSPLDLLHLRGHFGIPKFPAGALPESGGDAGRRAGPSGRVTAPQGGEGYPPAGDGRWPQSGQAQGQEEPQAQPQLPQQQEQQEQEPQEQVPQEQVPQAQPQEPQELPQEQMPQPQPQPPGGYGKPSPYPQR